MPHVSPQTDTGTHGGEISQRRRADDSEIPEDIWCGGGGITSVFLSLSDTKRTKDANRTDFGRLTA